MLNYASYEYYISTYNGTLLTDERLFNFYIGKASRLIDEVSNQQITESMLENQEIIKYVACELAELIGNDVIQGNISSKSIDGVSVTYNNNAKTEYNSEKARVLNQLPHELIRYI